MTRVISSEAPFGGLCTHVAPDGATIAEIIAMARPMPRGFGALGMVIVSVSKDGRLLREDVVPRHMWRRVRPRTRSGFDITVRLAIRLGNSGGGGGAGGGGSGKNIWTTVATVAVLALAALVSFGVFGTLGAFPLGAATITGAQVLGPAIAIGGALAIAALSPPPSFSALAAPEAAAVAPGITSGESASAASLSGNVLAPGGSIPRVIGTRRVYPPLACRPLVDMVGDDEVVEAVFVLNGMHEVTDLRIGDTLLSTIAEVSTEVTDWTDGNETAPTLVGRYSVTDQPAIELSKHKVDADLDDMTIQTPVVDNVPQWHSYSIRRGGDETWFSLVFPEGLLDADEAAGTDFAVAVRVRFREEGGTTWYYAPEFHCTARLAASFTRMIRIKFETAAGGVGPTRDFWRKALTVGVPMRVATAIGDGSGANNVFNSTVSTSGTGWSKTSATSGYVGANFYAGSPLGRSVTYVDVYPSTDAGFTTAANVTLNLRGKTSAPSSPSDGTLLGTTGSIADTTSKITITATDAVTRYQYLFIEVVPSASSTIYVAEVEFYDDGDYSWPPPSAGVSSSLNKQSLTVGLDPTRFMQDAKYEFQFMRSCSYVWNNLTFRPRGYSITDDASAIFLTDLFRFKQASGGQPQTIRSQENVHDRIVISRVAHVWNDEPVQTTGLTQIHLTARARAIENFNCLASGLVYDLSGSDGGTVVDRGAWALYQVYAANDLVDHNGTQYRCTLEHPSLSTSEPGVGATWATYWAVYTGGGSGGAAWDMLRATSNPAPHYRDVLAGSLSVTPVPDELLDDIAFANWRERCERYGYECNMVVEGKSVPEVLNVLAGCGRARPRQAEKFSVMVDRDRSTEAPVQLFSARNMRGFSWSSALGRLPDGIRATFGNAENNYDPDEIVALYDGVSDTGNYDVITYDGLVTSSEVRSRVQYDLDQRRLRFVFYSGEAPIEWIVARRGDLCGISYDIINRQAGAARVKSITLSGSDVVGLVLDGSVPTTGDTFFSEDGGQHYFTAAAEKYFVSGACGAMIRAKDGSYIVREIESSGDDETEITFTEPFTDPGIGSLDTDCLVVVGALGTEVKRVVVSGIVPKSGLTAQMTFVDEAPELWPIDNIYYWRSKTMKIVDVTMTLNTSQYTASDLLADAQLVSGLFRVTDGLAELDSIVVIDEDDQGAAFDIYFTNIASSWGTENSAPSISDANARSVQAIVPIATGDYKDLGGVRVACIKNIGAILQAKSGSKDIYVAIVNGSGTPTYTANGIRLKIGVLQN